LLIDDTFSHKTDKKIEAVGTFWDHTEKRPVPAHNIVTMQFVTRKGETYPLDFRLYLKEDHCQDKNLQFKTKHEPAEELVKCALGLVLEIQGVLFDSWYGSKEFLKFLRDNSLRWVTRLKSDRNIKIRGRCVQASQFAADIPKSAYREIRIRDDTYQVLLIMNSGHRIELKAVQCLSPGFL
jgi:hypothetical protein